MSTRRSSRGGPSEPSDWLVSAVQRFGGVTPLLLANGVSDRREIKRHYDRFDRARKRGWVSQFQAEEFRTLIKAVEMPAEIETTHLPVQPLLDYIGRRGGLRACIPGLPLHGDGQVDRVDRSAEELRLIKNVETAIITARGRGTITVATADNISVRVLGVHPWEIWGEDWWTFPGEDLEDVA